MSAKRAYFTFILRSHCVHKWIIAIPDYSAFPNDGSSTIWQAESFKLSSELIGLSYRLPKSPPPLLNDATKTIRMTQKNNK